MFDLNDLTVVKANNLFSGYFATQYKIKKGR